MRSVLLLSALTLTLTIFANPDPHRAQLVSSADAGYRVCEVWRDYYYNVETDEFIEWAGEPYETDICYTIGGGDPRPPHTTTGDPKPGVGRGVSGKTAEDVRKARCGQCGQGYTGCMNSVQTSQGICVASHQKFANYQCVERARGNGRGGITAGGHNFYELLMGKSKLAGYSRRDWEWGWKYEKGPGRKRVQIPTGPGFYNCQQSYSKSHPSWSLTDTLTASVTATINMPPFETGTTLGVTHTESTTWGGVTGYEAGCANAGGTAVSACSSALSACVQRYSCSKEETGVSWRGSDTGRRRAQAPGGLGR